MLSFFKVPPWKRPSVIISPDTNWNLSNCAFVMWVLYFCFLVGKRREPYAKWGNELNVFLSKMSFSIVVITFVIKTDVIFSLTETIISIIKFLISVIKVLKSQSCHFILIIKGRGGILISW